MNYFVGGQFLHYRKEDLMIARENHSLQDIKDLEINQKFLGVNVKETDQFIADEVKKQIKIEHFEKEQNKRKEMRKKLGLVPNRLGEAEQIQRYRDEIDQKLKLSTPPRNQKRVERVTFKYKHSFTNPPI